MVEAESVEELIVLRLQWAFWRLQKCLVSSDPLELKDRLKFH